MSTDFETLHETARARLDTLRRLEDSLTALRVTHTGASGAITITVDAGAQLLDIALTPAISEMTPDEFGRALVETAALAARRALAGRAALVTEFNAEMNE